MEQTSEKSFSSKVSLNMLSNVVRIGVMALLGLLMVPYYIDELGMAVYGLLPLATSLTTYVLIASDSLASSFSRYLIMALESGDDDRAIVTYSSTIIGMTKAILKIVPVVLILAFISPYVFQIGPANATDVQLMFAFILLSSLVISFASCLNSIFYSQNLLYHLYYIKTAYTIIQVGMIITLFMVYGPSLVLIGVSFFVSSMIYLIWQWIAAKFICPSLYVSRKKYDKALLKEMSALGFWAMLSLIGTMMFIQTSLILVNLFLGAEIESEFSIVANMISMLNTTCMALTAVGEPLIYRYYSEGDKEKLWSTLGLFTKLVGLIVVFPIAYICIFTTQVLNVWIGYYYEYITIMARIMVPANIAVCAMHILNCVYLVHSRLREVAIATCFFGVTNVALACILLAVMQDPVGASIAWSISILLLSAVFMPLFASKIMGVSNFIFLKPIVICYAVFGLLWGAGYFLTEYWTMPSSFLWLIVTVGGGFIVYFILIFFLLLNRNEKSIVLTYMPQSIQNIVLKFIH